MKEGHRNNLVPTFLYLLLCPRLDEREIHALHGSTECTVLNYSQSFLLCGSGDALT